MSIDDSNTLRIATRVGQVGIWRWDMSSNLVEYDAQGRSIFCLDQDEKHINYESWFELIHPDDRERIFCDLKNAVESQGMYEGQYRIVRRDGSSGYIKEIGQMQFDENGQATEMVGVTQDVTHQVELEETVRHKLRMETVGQIAGGVAHDFNNILAVLMTNLELLSVDRESELVPKLLETSLDAVKRGASLTHQLLAFSRKQTLAASAIDLSQTLILFEEMLRRTLEENISLDVSCDSNIWNCHADEDELHNVLFNLAINARDAMPQGGKITIEAANVTVGELREETTRELESGLYTCISLSDTGSGIEKEILQRVFEPFFTTKERGEGTGLGLSMAHGFAKQSGGDLHISSVKGKGTTIRLFLPRTSSQAFGKESSVEGTPNLKGCKVLVVEDDQQLRTSIVHQLHVLGCETRDAGDADEALAISKKENDFDFLLMDVILSGPLNGPKLSEELLLDCPHAAVVFMSGYVDEELHKKGLLAPKSQLLKKPFRQFQLAQRLSDARIAQFGSDVVSNYQNLSSVPR